MEKFNVAIIGGGAAGLACAVTLAKNEALKVLVLEAGERAGKKLSSTGNGQGNIFNADNSVSHYRSGNLALVEKVACREDASQTASKIFGSMLYKVDSFGRGYPNSLQASSLTDILLSRLKRGGVELCLSTRVQNIKKINSPDFCGFSVDCGDKKYLSEYAVLAAGGKAQKQFLTDGSAYKLAESFGHKITELYPAIVQLKTDTAYTKNLKGIRANCAVRAVVQGKEAKSVTADIIFTDYGVSGNAAFYLSSVLTRGGELVLDFLPDRTQAQIEEVLLSRQKEGMENESLLCGILHNQIARSIFVRAGFDIKNIAKVAKNFSLKVTGTLGFDYAQVTQGGVDMRGVADNLESKLCKNLYFAGEMLDVDGDCGGYNLNWAFSSGIFVAEDILSRYEKA